MSVDGLSTSNADGLANTLETTLTAGKDFSLPVLNLDDPAFAWPETVGNPIYTAVTKLTEADLTTRVISGTGMFDGLMVAMSNHIQQEYQAGRISGSEYAQAYVQMSTAVLGSAVNYLLAKDQAYWQAQLVQKQAQAAEIAVIGARVSLEVARADLAIARAKTDLVAVEYAVSKIRLANEDVQYALGLAQLAGVEYTNANLLPAQLAGVLKTTQIADYQLTYVLPKEVEKSQKAIELTAGQISQVVAQKDQVLYQTATLLPSQNSNTIADTNTKLFQISTVMPASVAGINADTAGKLYSNSYLLPANLEGIKENNESNRSKTMDTRSDGVTVIKGQVGKQNALYDQQIGSYKRADEAKVAKMLLDTWITQKSMDEGLVPPTSLTDSNINTVMGKLRTNLLLT